VAIVLWILNSDDRLESGPHPNQTQDTINTYFGLPINTLLTEYSISDIARDEDIRTYLENELKRFKPKAILIGPHCRVMMEDLFEVLSGVDKKIPVIKLVWNEQMSKPWKRWWSFVEITSKVDPEEDNKVLFDKKVIEVK
jgi:hypothetical protein